MLILTTAVCVTLLAAATQPAIDASRWKLVWSDEFDRAGALDANKWKCEVGFIRNNEKQYYTKDRRENVRVEDGCLVIEARKERFEVPDKPGTFADYTAASVETSGMGEWKYGRIEVRAKIPTGRGMWPAIWMLPDSISKVGWPACGEIDIMENVGYEPNKMHGTVHTKAYNHVMKTEKNGTLMLERPWENFHIYAVEWSAQKIDFFIDDKLYFTFKNEGKGADTWPFDQPFYLKINTAVGGNWGGQKGIDDAAFPNKFMVDYVRVYQAVN
jgi:beta-glucanase (GH16 family)